MTIDVVPNSEKSPVVLDDASTADLVREAMDEVRELVRLEIELGKEEVKLDLKQAQHAAIGLGIGAGASFIVLCLLAVAIVLAFGGTAVAALLVAAAFLVIGGIAAGIGYSMLPKSPLEKTRLR